MSAWFRSVFGSPKPSGPTVTLRRFGMVDAPISTDIVAVTGEAWVIELSRQQVVRLFELPDVALENCMLTYRADMRSEDLEGQAFLEMWVRLPGRGEFFSRGLNDPVVGTTSWASYETPFYLKRGQKADLVKLNVSAEGPGKVWMRNIELLMTPL